LNVASKRRQGGNVETSSDLACDIEAAEVEEAVIVAARSERDAQEQRAYQNR
jgi:hypothetical protein